MDNASPLPEPLDLLAPHHLPVHKRGEVGGAAERTFSNPRFLVADGRYTSPIVRPSIAARCFPSLVFYAIYSRIVLRASRQAKRGAYHDWEWGASSLEILHALERVGVRFEISGLEHLAAVGGPFVIAGNHMSTLETMVLPAVVLPFSRATFVIKQSLLDYPVFKHVMRSRKPIAVSQADPRGDFKKVLEQGPPLLDQGVSIILFPEGARRHKFVPQNFNSLGVKLARRAGVPLIPLALCTDAWPMGPCGVDFGRIDARRPARLAFGPPIEVDAKAGEAQQATLEFITRQLEAWECGSAESASHS